eukprot:Blabericola_migrator_1__13206@NODE_911_length_6105_cov_137_973501_g636_i0_p1_GENE_NODE_911_length_6105_cov_137_973501_g636_i0NODE_911_length_6105_cov_137_973501_g636_i0_p1_ORF_typecomplete_len514_score106_01RRM_1/PF00076_22/0_0011RRM_1/PF00076_22/5_8e16RRM_1/PF00076_22/0_038RRM_1/PF00076_22/8_8e02RRM_7/PF16367_5/1_1RRM_7/PF16367_5/1_4e05RRM_5/PF13893_6/6_1e02RRM_5/PF13893_6/3_9RRM_5/PF13893_6/0_0044RRM_occluded/PF16842_5/1_3RRM_occluded/PF16842_5/0_98RRM_occluded/PF16842_5/1_8e02RRM_Rrp7/PF17799
MSRQSGWSHPPVTSANAVPIGQPRNFSSGPDNSAEGGTGATSNTSNDPTISLPAATLPPTIFSAVPLDAASKHARKVYIGNLPPSATSESMITEFFNQTLQALLPHKLPGDPVISTYLNVAKRFAFIENRSIEETTFCLGLDGIQMDGYALKLRRPQDYNAQLAQQQLQVEMRMKGGISALRGAWNPMQNQLSDTHGTAAGASSGIVSTSVEDGPNKVFIGGLPHHMTEQEVKDLLASFGSLKAFHLVKDRDLDRSKGFAFCEWREPSITDIACQALNGMKIGDRFLNVRRAIPHSAHRALPGAVTGGTVLPITNMSNSDLAAASAAVPLALPYLPPKDNNKAGSKVIPPLDLPELSLCMRKESSQGSRCVAFQKIVPATIDPSQVDKVQAITDEIKRRAAQLGKVRNAEFNHSNGGQVLVEYSLPEEALFASKYFNGAEFDGLKAECKLTELTSDMRRTCLSRLTAEVEMLARLDAGARQLYLERERAQRARREMELEKFKSREVGHGVVGV